VLQRPYDPLELVAAAVKMREEISRHKPASGPLDVKLGDGGLVDLEFSVHVLQLARKSGLDPSLEQAVEQLAEDGFIETKVVHAQHLLTQMLVTIRLVAPETASPSEESCDLMARACGTDSWKELLARHGEARQSISELWNRVKEGNLG